MNMMILRDKLLKNGNIENVVFFDEIYLKVSGNGPDKVESKDKVKENNDE